jgi:hypothetical protein
MQVSKNLPAIQKIIDRLEVKNWQVRLSHDPKNTRTTIMVIEHGRYRTTKDQFTGIARCTKDDQFCRAAGTRIAFNRAIHNMSRKLGRLTVKELVS